MSKRKWIHTFFNSDIKIGRRMTKDETQVYQKTHKTSLLRRVNRLLNIGCQLSAINYSSSITGHQLLVTNYHSLSVVDYCRWLSGLSRIIRHWSLVADYWLYIIYKLWVINYWSLIISHISSVTDYWSPIIGCKSVVDYWSLIIGRRLSVTNYWLPIIGWM